MISLIEIILGFIIMSLLGIVSYKIGFVDITGLISSFAIGIVIWITGGISIFISLLFFFVAAGAATKYKYKIKKEAGVQQENKGRRSWKNVVSSGILPMILSIILYICSINNLNLMLPYIATMGAIGTTTADTLASELGVLSKSKPRLITSLRKKVSRGTVGAVSMEGEKIALLSGAVVGVLGGVFSLLPGMIAWNGLMFTSIEILLIVLGVSFVSFLGCNLDSLFGALFQTRNVCEICGLYTDKKFHCGYETRKNSGYRFVNNEIINFGSSVMGGVLGILIFSGFIIYVLIGLFSWIAISSK